MQERRRTRHRAAHSIATGALLIAAPLAILAQQTVVTSRPCQFGASEPAPGPACLIASKELGPLPTGPVYWHIDIFPEETSARQANDHNGSVVRDFGQVWLFTVADRTWRAKGGSHAATIGPLPTAPAASFTAEYVHSYFAPGMSAPIHQHSGPEAFYAIDGDTCLEMPGGAHIGHGPGNTAIMPAGEPMLLMAIGKVPRRAFALVLHDASLPATTRVDTWTPTGRCRAAL
jgi:quercetin dioxygenase-like cupin family protein